MKFATVSKSLVMGLALMLASSAFASDKGKLQINHPITVNGTNLQANCLYSDYAITRSATGELTWAVTGALADGTVPSWS